MPRSSCSSSSIRSTIDSTTLFAFFMFTFSPDLILLTTPLVYETALKYDFFIIFLTSELPSVFSSSRIFLSLPTPKLLTCAISSASASKDSREEAEAMKALKKLCISSDFKAFLNTILPNSLFLNSRTRKSKLGRYSRGYLILASLR